MPPRYHFEVGRPDGTTTAVYLSDWVNWTSMVAGGNLSECLAPGGRDTLDYCLGLGIGQCPKDDVDPAELHRSAEAVFPTVGEYRVQLVLPRFGASGIRSNTLSISIKAPETPPDVLAHGIVSNSNAPGLFLAPPSEGTIVGIDPLMWWRFDGTGQNWFEVKRQLTEEMCPEIVTRYPDSAYAPYARLFWAWALCHRFVKPAVDGEEAPDVERRVQGIDLLRPSAQDPNLPRRYREAALEILIRTATELAEFERDRAIKVLPSIESILGVAVDNMRGKSPGPVYRKAHQLLVGAEGAEISYGALQRVFTAEQIETLKAAVASNEVIQAALEVSPLQNELRDLAAWARSELAKLPWRDPNTGELRMKFSMQPGCL